MPNICLIITVDYELFGDGTGDIRREQCIPTEHLANILELHGARLTIFVETGQQIFFRKQKMHHQFQPIEEQIRNLYSKGHDIQLHIHPMWFFNPPLVNERPTLNYSLYDLSLMQQSNINDIVKKSCNYLKKIITPIQPNYKPIAYRAGAWSIQRKNILFPILSKHGIKIDSTIAPGAYFNSDYGQFDFRNYKMKSYWHEGPLIEVPILTERSCISAIKQVNHYGIDTRQIIGSFYKKKLAQQHLSKVGKLFNVLRRHYFMADYNLLSPEQLVKMILKYANHNRDAVPMIPVVLIGHSKSTYFTDRFFKFFNLLNRTKLNISYSTFNSFLSSL